MCISVYGLAEQSSTDCSVDERKKEEIQSPVTASQKMQTFLQQHCCTIISLACTMASLYMSYYFSNEALKMSRASFLLDRGVVALKNIWMIPAGYYDKYIALGQKTCA